ncbi:MAG: hypothetical protein KFB93_06935 [Simkaniaceae bacterium]|nr:MAG: hypothetical protein KFB93_06935 [Simkaniaceae bacterium]
MTRQKTWPFFLIALFFALTSLFPVLPFSPYLAILYRQSEWLKALWISVLCGLILDLLGASPFGLHALQMLLVTVSLYRMRIYFINKPIGLASYTALISLALTIFSRFSLIFYDAGLPFTFKGLVTDFIFMPFIDALYAFLFFSCPLILYRLLRKLYFHFLFLKKETNKKEEELP